MLELVVSFAVGFMILVVIIKMLSLPFKILKKLIVNSLIGALMLWLVSFLGAPFGLAVNINIISALIAGTLGIPGVLLILAYTNMHM
ncbi:MAG: pro-sigmaK processing inhibitor BofA family protein [Selenomonadaceae bacterium]|nr:pro-sigmaK processing inhibitor BofA family protein [Selenomonadaceae bacterium]